MKKKILQQLQISSAFIQITKKMDDEGERRRLTADCFILHRLFCDECQRDCVYFLFYYFIGIFSSLLLVPNENYHTVKEG